MSTTTNAASAAAVTSSTAASAASKSAPPSSSTGPPGAPSVPASFSPSARVSDLDVDLLSLIHDIVRTLEKDTPDLSQKNKDSLDASQKILSLHKKIEKLRTQIYQLPGVRLSPADQRRQLQTLRQQLQRKKGLIAKYKQLKLKRPAPSASASLDADASMDTGNHAGSL